MVSRYMSVHNTRENKVCNYYMTIHEACTLFFASFLSGLLFTTLCHCFSFIVYSKALVSLIEGIHICLFCSVWCHDTYHRFDIYVVNLGPIDSMIQCSPGASFLRQSVPWIFFLTGCDFSVNSCIKLTSPQE